MKAFHLITISLLVSITITVYPQAPNWQWATGPTGQGVVSAVCTDANSNAYITGHFLGPLIFGTDTVNVNLGPYQNVFVAKYSATGNALWAKNAIGYADAMSISTDASGNVYVTGDFYNDSITFGSYVLTDTIPDNSNVFLVKYDSLGDVLWAKNLGGTTNDFTFGVSTDLNNNVYLTGYFTGDSLTLGNIVLRQAGINTVFLVKLNPTGSVIWAKSEGGAVYDGPNAICTNASGDVFITGYFTSSKMIFGTDTLNSPYTGNIFTTGYDSSGNVLWSKWAGGNNGNASTGIAADASGNVYITGYFSNSLTLGDDTLTGNGLQNIFTAKYDATGNILWASGTGGTYVDQANGIATDGNGNAYITGYFQSDTITFGSLEIINPTGNQITFVAEYDVNGQPLWAIAPGGTSNNTAAGLAYNNGSMYVSGAFSGANIIFGNDTLQQALANIFTAKLDSFIATGITPISPLSNNITIYPNPSSGSFYFKGLTEGNSVEVYNLLGEMIYKGVSVDENYLVNLSGKAKGVYLYRINDENGANIGAGEIVIE